MHNLLTLNLADSLTARRLADGTPFADAFARLTEQHAGIHERLLSYRDQWPLGWLDAEKLRTYLQPCHEVGYMAWDCFGELIVCGIGGSALGTQAIYKALNYWHGIEFVQDYDQRLREFTLLDNVDPGTLFRTRVHVEGRTDFPAINVISKSGTTLETMAAFLRILEERERWIRWNKYSSRPERQIIATTDSARGVLGEWADREKWPTFPVPNDVGGRFSVFTPVGLFPLAFSGVEIEALLDGARTWQSSATSGDLAHNEAWQLAALHYLLHTQGGANCAVHYIYGDPLVLLGDWFRQLWAESLAKRQKLDGSTGDGACLTPIVARGTTDQHSQNQLYMEGPDDKVYGFITCEKWPEDPVVLSKESELQIPPELEYLRGRTFGELLEACRLGTRDALIELGRPVYEIILPELAERSIGAYMQMWMLATAYAGLLYNVNAFDQPGVERSKQLAMARLLDS